MGENYGTSPRLAPLCSSSRLARTRAPGAPGRISISPDWRCLCGYCEKGEGEPGGGERGDGCRVVAAVAVVYGCRRRRRRPDPRVVGAARTAAGGAALRGQNNQGAFGDLRAMGRNDTPPARLV